MQKTLQRSLLVLLIFIALFSSCVNQKQIAYFQKGINGSDTMAVAKAYVPKIQPGDILAINVGSLNPVASSFFNPYSSTPIISDNTSGAANGVSAIGSAGIAPAASQSTAQGFLVDPSGTVELPLIGSLKIAGLNTSEARDTIKNRLKTYLKEPTVNVRFLNYKISVMGEVARPSVYVIPNERITLPEALSMAGDMTIFGKRENVLIIRDENGKKQFGHIDLTSREVYTSPYYYLHANDIVYVEPGKGRIAQTDKIYQILPVILSALSLISIIVIYGHK
ncbi:polysaccharide export protein [Mucilaginibacter corticis]|uniref:Polysaccharide export protein n=1 Tax=Mucilaginibacter corticis TaxID=2597670 RepID=A0A556MT11_9SPHI|nr:polysaccharide biosynthesis/export family protein [Mucilaginibacter corticis]TSJ43080.1 polysaccharide export protein [Mucilaginibacter corticis]